MTDRYLWDRSGDPDPEIVRLEQALAPLRLLPTLEAPASVVSAPGDAVNIPEPAVKQVRRRIWRPALAGAVGLAAAAAVTLWVAARPSTGPAPSSPVVAGPAMPAAASEPPAAWLVAPLAGAPRVAEVAVQVAGPAASGAVVETDRHSRARISMGDIGQVELDAGTRVRLVSAGSRHRLGLERGVLHALIWAPAGRFDVETPAGVVTDLGCAYTLAVDDSGGGEVTVSSGWVGFEYRGRESLIPAGASARLQEGRGPGTPLVPGSTRPLRQLVKIVDGGSVDSAAAAAARQLTSALAGARPDDAVTLWHLLARVPPGWRGAIYDRLAVLAPPPSGIDRPGIVAGDPQMHDRWWDALDYGPIADWRRWKASASPLP